jgi:hypothetical protein
MADRPITAHLALRRKLHLKSVCISYTSSFLKPCVKKKPRLVTAVSQKSLAPPLYPCLIENDRTNDDAYRIKPARSESWTTCPEVAMAKKPGAEKTSGLDTPAPAPPL